MKRTEAYDDPIFANGLRSWMDAAAPAAAPERLVFRVMDEVERAPRRRWITTRPLIANVVRYAALTLVITIGVAGGILLTRGVPNVGGPTAPPSPSGPIPSLRPIGGFDTNGRLLAGGRDGAWLATADAALVPIDTSGHLGEPVEIGYIATGLAVDVEAGPRARETVWAVAPQGDLLRLDTGVGELIGSKDAAGSQVVLGANSVWVTKAGAVQRVDAALMTGLGSFETPGHRATDPLVIVDDTTWLADATGIDRRAISTGASLARLPVGATALVVTGGLVWAAQRERIVALDPGSGELVATAALPIGVSAIDAVAARGDSLWLATSGAGGPLLIGIDPTTRASTSSTRLATAAVSIALVGNQVWTLDSTGHVDRFEPGS